MPDPLQYEFNKFNQSEEKKHRSVQFSGLYCIGSPESIYWRVKFGHKPFAVKVGKSVDCLRRFNEYRLYYPFADNGMKVYLMLMMPHALTKAKKQRRPGRNVRPIRAQTPLPQKCQLARD